MDVATRSITMLQDLQQQIRGKVYIYDSTIYARHVHANIGIISFVIICAVFSLCLRLWRGAWMYKVVETEKGSWIVPNALVCFLVYTIIFFSVAQGFAQTSLQFGQQGSDLTNTLLWRGLSFIPLFLCTWHLVWATAVSPLLSPKARVHPSSTFNPWAVNTFFVGFPFTCFLPIVITSVIANSHGNAAFNAFRAVDRNISNAIDSLRASDAQSFLLTLVEQINTLVVVIEYEIGKARYVHTLTIVFWATCSGCLLLLFFFSFVLHYQSISQATAKNDGMVLVDMIHNRKYASTKNAYRTLFWTSSLTFLMTATFFSISVAFVIEEKKMQGQLESDAIVLATLYNISIWGLLSSVVILVRTLSLFAYKDQRAGGGNKFGLTQNKGLGDNQGVAIVVENEMATDFSAEGYGF